MLDKLHSIDKTLAEHVAECTAEKAALRGEINTLNREIRGFKKLIWTGVGFGMGLPWTIVAWMLVHSPPWVVRSLP